MKQALLIFKNSFIVQYSIKRMFDFLYYVSQNNKMTFKKIILYVCLVLSFSCANIDNIEFKHNTTVEVPGQLINSGPLQGVVDFSGFNDFNSSFSQSIDNEGIEIEKVDYVKIKSMLFEVNSPDDQDLSFFNSIDIYIQADGLDRVRIAFQTIFPIDESIVSMNIVDIDLKPYLEQESMFVSTNVVGSSPDQNTQIEINTVFDVDINLKNAIF